jgi:hypothetical protein
MRASSFLLPVSLPSSSLSGSVGDSEHAPVDPLQSQAEKRMAAHEGEQFG